MIEAFNELEEEKKARIINAALAEFAAQGFDKASTNKIVADAGISKGILFYYFENKRGLFDFLCEYAVSSAEGYYRERTVDDGKDFVGWLEEVSKIKLEFFCRHRDIANFLSSLFLKDNIAHVCAATLERITGMKKRFSHRIYNADYSVLFRDDIQPAVIMKMIQYLFDGYERSMVAQLEKEDLANIDYAPYWADFHEVLDATRLIFFK